MVELLLPEFVAAVGGGPVRVDGTQVTHAGQALLQLGGDAGDQGVAGALRQPRQLIGLRGLTAATLEAQAQQPAMPLVGLLSARGPRDDPHLTAGHVNTMLTENYFRVADRAVPRLSRTSCNG